MGNEIKTSYSNIHVWWTKQERNSSHYYFLDLWFVYWFISRSKSIYITIYITAAHERNNAATADDYVDKTFDRILTCRALPHTESDASDNEADGNKPYIIFRKSS